MKKLTVMYGNVAGLKDTFIKEHSEYTIVKENELFSSTRKIGPLTIKNKKSSYEILMSDPVIKKYGSDYIIKQLKPLGMADIVDRVPCALSNSQKLRYSLFLDVFYGKKYFYFDGVNDKNKYYYGDVFKFLTQCDEFDGEAIWFTNDNKFNIMLALGENMGDVEILYVDDEGVHEDNVDLSYDALATIKSVENNPREAFVKVGLEPICGSFYSNKPIYYITADSRVFFSGTFGVKENGKYVLTYEAKNPKELFYVYVNRIFFKNINLIEGAIVYTQK